MDWGANGPIRIAGVRPVIYKAVSALFNPLNATGSLLLCRLVATDHQCLGAENGLQPIRMGDWGRTKAPPRQDLYIPQQCGALYIADVMIH